MAEPEVPYRRLPGRAPWLRASSSSAPNSSLWLGPDHLLLAIRTATREEYRRFDYQDIQEVFVQETNRRAVINIVLGIIIALFLVICMLSNFGPVSTTFLFIFGVPCAIFLLSNSLRGPCCRGYLLTAVGVETLSSLARLGPARRAVDLLTAEIERVQGALEPSTLALHWTRRTP